MQIDTVEEPIRFRLHGISAPVENERYAEVGMGLMDAMWNAIKGAGTPTEGINHWVYLPDGRMFVGVVIREEGQASIPQPLELLEFELRRYAKHLHVGPYRMLPQVWKSLMAELAARGEKIGSPCLEIYGHHCDESSDPETTILICLQAKTV